MIWIGIDTGTHTGVAVWDSDKKEFKEMQTLLIHQAMQRVMDWDLIAQAADTSIHVVFEDARQRKWYSGDASAKMQGAGSIKRDAAIREDFLKDYGYEFTMVAPQKGMTKMNEDSSRQSQVGRAGHQTMQGMLLCLFWVADRKSTFYISKYGKE